jgi:hypothetical protein
MSSFHGRQGCDSRVRRHRGSAGRRAGADRQWQCGVHRRRPRRQGGGGIARAGARGVERLGPRDAAKRITVNLAPADLPKEGSHYDLPIALGIIAAIGAIAPDALQNYTVLGELALDGTITAVAGVLPAAIAANARGTG